MRCSTEMKPSIDDQYRPIRGLIHVFQIHVRITSMAPLLSFRNHMPSFMTTSTLGPTFLICLIVLPLVVAAPIETNTVMVEGNSQVVAYGQRPAYRTAVVVVCILYASLLALAHGEYATCCLKPTSLTETRLSSRPKYRQDNKQSHRSISHCARDYLHGFHLFSGHQHCRTWTRDGCSVSCRYTSVHCIVHGGQNLPV
jgi:hypothetical protein